MMFMKVSHKEVFIDNKFLWDSFTSYKLPELNSYELIFKTSEPEVLVLLNYHYEFIFCFFFVNDR